jgi:hypothetical protein
VAQLKEIPMPINKWCGKISKGFGPYLFSQNYKSRINPYTGIFRNKFKKAKEEGTNAMKLYSESITLYWDNYSWKDKINRIINEIDQIGILKFLWLFYSRHAFAILFLVLICLVCQSF